MKKVLIHIILFILISSSAIGQEKCTVKVNITTNVDSSLIFINDEFVSRGEYSYELEKGDYNLVVMRSEKEWGSELIKDSLSISSCDKEIYLKYNFDKTTVVLSDPWSTVTAGDSILGHTPLSLEMNYETVELTRNGFESTKINLENVPVQSRTKLNFSGLKEQETFFETTLFKVLIGSAVALGATAAYFKLKADDNFDKYTETRKSEFLDNTDKYDLYSGIAFGALQLNFGALLYYFLIE